MYLNVSTPHAKSLNTCSQLHAHHQFTMSSAASGNQTSSQSFWFKLITPPPPQSDSLTVPPHPQGPCGLHLPSFWDSLCISPLVVMSRRALPPSCVMFWGKGRWEALIRSAGEVNILLTVFTYSPEVLSHCCRAEIQSSDLSSCSGTAAPGNVNLFTSRSLLNTLCMFARMGACELSQAKTKEEKL